MVCFLRKMLKNAEITIAAKIALSRDTVVSRAKFIETRVKDLSVVKK